VQWAFGEASGSDKTVGGKAGRKNPHTIRRTKETNRRGGLPRKPGRGCLLFKEAFLPWGRKEAGGRSIQKESLGRGGKCRQNKGKGNKKFAHEM